MKLNKKILVVAHAAAFCRATAPSSVHAAQTAADAVKAQLAPASVAPQQ